MTTTPPSPPPGSGGPTLHRPARTPPFSSARHPINPFYPPAKNLTTGP